MLKSMIISIQYRPTYYIIHNTKRYKIQKSQKSEPMKVKNHDIMAQSFLSLD